MSSGIDEIINMKNLLHVGIDIRQGYDNKTQKCDSGASFHELLKEKIEINNVNIKGYVENSPLPSEKLKLLAEVIQLQFKSMAFSQMDDIEDDLSYGKSGFSMFDFPGASSLIDSLVSNIKQVQPGEAKVKGHQPESENNKNPSIEKVISQASQKYDVAPDLIRSVIRAESDFNPECTSPKGAMGLMQLMPETAKELEVTRPYDILDNIMGGTRYLKMLLDRYDGNRDLALAAYNWGMGNLERNPESLPLETRNYIARINKYLAA